MKKFAMAIFIATMVLSGCTQAQNGQTNGTAQVPPSQTQTTTVENSYVYPARNAKVGETYGQMTLAKMDPEAMYATFKGDVTVSGTYQFSPAEEIFSLGDQICFTIQDIAEVQKIPQSSAFTYLKDSTKSFCFSNYDEAKKLLGTGKGTATIMISSLDDIIDAEADGIFNSAVLKKVITKTEEKIQWQVYTNKLHDYSISYPSTWKVNESMNDTTKSNITISDKKDPSIDIGITIKKNIFPEKNTAEWSKTSAWPYENLQGYKNIVVDGVNGLEDDQDGRIVVVKGNRIYIIENGTGMVRKVIDDNLFNQMVSTFKFKQ